MRIAEQERTRVADVPCGIRALCGWSPPSLPANSAVKRRVDRIRLGNLATAGIVAVVVGLLNLSAHLPAPSALVVVGLAGLAAGGWCSLNFWRCRHAHCLVTGAGWLVLALFAIVETGIGRSVIHGGEQIIFLAVLAAGLLFEGGWYLTRRTNAFSGWRR